MVKAEQNIFFVYSVLHILQKKLDKYKLLVGNFFGGGGR
jgi:hypothetical protein